MRHRQKIAIARIISDLIKSDTIICCEEIEAYNKLLNYFNIYDSEIFEAQYISLSDALAIVKNMSDDEKQCLLRLLKGAAYSDHICVAQEALLLLAIAYIINDKDDKFWLFSSDFKERNLAEKYVIYIESDYMPVINDEICQSYEAISNMLRLWNFEFIYIPKLSQSFRDLDQSYLYDILRYMNPRLSVELFADLYKRLTTFTTESFACDYLANVCKTDLFYDVQPSLLINIGTSFLPSKSQLNTEKSYMNMLVIRLDDEENSVLNEVRRFINEYEQYITESEYHRKPRGKGLFRYHGLYKHLFDFLACNQTIGEENSLLIDISKRKVWMRGIEISLSGMHLATYIFILHQTFCTHHGGLHKVGQHHPLSDLEIQRLTNTFRAICKLFRESTSNLEHSYLEEVNNIRSYIARIRTVITNNIDSEYVNYYIPKDSIHKDMYHITLDPTRIRIRDSQNEYIFKDFPLWKHL
jgi:hypothetical protein